MGLHRDAEAASTRAVKDGNCAGVGRVFQDDGIAGTNKSFADQIERLLTAVRDEEIFVADGEAFLTQEFEKGFFKGAVAVRGAEVQDIGGFAAQDSVNANL